MFLQVPSVNVVDLYSSYNIITSTVHDITPAKETNIKNINCDSRCKNTYYENRAQGTAD